MAIHDMNREDRPGVPREAEPMPADGARWASPPPQPRARTRVRSASVAEPTPVFGNAQPLRELSGVMRRTAYRMPEHKARHWLTLMLADRIDVAEDRIGRALSAPVKQIGFNAIARTVERHPLKTLGALWLVGWLLQRKVASLFD